MGFWGVFGFWVFWGFGVLGFLGLWVFGFGGLGGFSGFSLGFRGLVSWGVSLGEYLGTLGYIPPLNPPPLRTIELSPKP